MSWLPAAKGPHGLSQKFEIQVSGFTRLALLKAVPEALPPKLRSPKTLKGEGSSAIQPYYYFNTGSTTLALAVLYSKV